MSDIPPKFQARIKEAKEQGLTELDLSSDDYPLLNSIPIEVFELEQLRSLKLTNNNIATIPPDITRLTHLQFLDLWGNRFQEFPHVLGNLQNLVILRLSLSSLDCVPQWLAEIKELSLDLSSNQLTELPESLSQLTNLTRLDLRDNPLKYPPLEVANRGIEEIAKYFQQFQSGKDYLYEAKLLIVGEAGAGKTTLAKKIQNPNYQLQEEDSTQGIDVITHNFMSPNQENFRINMWDFGGQEIYHATHQFFLTKTLPHPKI